MYYHKPHFLAGSKAKGGTTSECKTIPSTDGGERVEEGGGRVGEEGGREEEREEEREREDREREN